MGMPDQVYSGLRNVSWECFRCGLPNVSTSIFDTTLFESSNSFSVLTNSPASDIDISFNYPTATSSPKRQPSSALPHQRKDIPLRVVILNCQSIKANGRQAQLKNLISSVKADVVIGSESWLDPSIKSQEVFPSNFKTYRKDRQEGKGGGVFLLISDQYESNEPEELKADSNSCELVWSKVKIIGCNDLYIGSFYRPPNRTDPDYISNLQSYLSRIPTSNGAHLWLGGDFNLPDINWEDENVKPYASNGTLCNQLLSTVKDSLR